MNAIYLLDTMAKKLNITAPDLERAIWAAMLDHGVDVVGLMATW